MKQEGKCLKQNDTCRMKHNIKNSHYACNGNGGEYHIKELGYFPDYINFDLKVIMEWDEKRHFDENGNLKKEDLVRQKEITNHFPDFEFIRINGETKELIWLDY